MNKLLPTGFLFFVSTSASASGGDVLSLFWFSILVLVIVIGSLLIAKLKLKEKLVIFSVYLVAASIVFMATFNMPYMKNMYLINSANTLVPLLAWLTIYVYYIKKEKT
ncbi:hypothetical protein O4G98_20720 [Zoogloeaceae bacterium G21618-S1]|nr:hypothetical protein [Zoogloeaceae bacterium G21618-S1]